MRRFLSEAAFLQRVVPHNRCPATDALEVLADQMVEFHTPLPVEEEGEVPQMLVSRQKAQGLRLGLEDTVDRDGCTYTLVPKEAVYRWPLHISNVRPFLMKCKDATAADVYSALDLLTKPIEADVLSIRRHWLPVAQKVGIPWFLLKLQRFASEIEDDPDSSVYEAGCEVNGSFVPFRDSCLTRVGHVLDKRVHLYLFGGGSVEAEPLLEDDLLDDPEEEEAVNSGYWRMECLHQPVVEEDQGGNKGKVKRKRDPATMRWAEKQPAAWQSLMHYCRAARSTSSERTEYLRSRLKVLKGECHPKALACLWDALKQSEDYLVSPPVWKSIRWIRRVTNPVVLARAGAHLMDIQSGKRELDHTVSKWEMKRIWESYWDKKLELQRIYHKGKFQIPSSEEWQKSHELTVLEPVKA